MLATISKFKNAILKSEYLKKLSQQLHISEDAVLQELKKVKQQFPASWHYETEPIKMVTVNPTEKLLVKLMLEETELIHKIKGFLSPDDFQDSKVSKIVSTMFDLVEQSKNPQAAVLINSLGDENISRLICESSFGTEIPDEQNKEEVINDCISRLKKRSLLSRRKRIQESIRLAEATGDEDSLNRLKQEFNCLIKDKAGEK
jgi:replicative DNA helicase